MYSDTEIHEYRNCLVCGSSHLNGARGGRPICPECKAIAEQEKIALRRAKRRFREGVFGSFDALTVINDPDECGGGFEKGNIISATECNFMLSHGYFTSKTVLRNKRNEYYLIIWDCEKEKQKMIKIDYQEFLNNPNMFECNE